MPESAAPVWICVCGATFPDVDARVHAYVPAIAGCWEAFGLVQANEYQRFGYPEAHMLVVDAYMAQHPGDGTDRRDRQSVYFHLVRLAAWQSGMSRGATEWHARRLTSAYADFPVLQPPARPAAITIVDMADSCDPDDYADRAERWGRAVWESWSHEHQRFLAHVT